MTGFATEEFSDENDYYLPRNKDAHAWAEAFDRDKQRWVVVEATPGVELPKSVWDQIADEDSESVGDGGGAGDMINRDTWSSMLIGWWAQIRDFFEELGRQLRGPLNITLVSFLVCLIVYRYWWKRRILTLSQSRQGKLERERLKVEKLLAKLKFSRESNETMQQFERRIRKQADQQLLDDISHILNWFRDYEYSRFGGETSLESIPPAPSLSR